MRKDSIKKIYYDGPITANNTPHYGHAISWTLKDIVPRYWSMKNFYVSRNMGWDCQGLPVEIEVEKTLGFKDKEDIEKFGIEKFNQLCKESVFKYKDAIYHYETRLGRWFDDTDVYHTMDKNFIESMWWSFKELYSKDFIYEGFKVVPYSTRAGCSLSHQEVADGGYSELEDPYITIRFKLKDTENTYILAWTTTPWTMPGNLMLAIGKKIKYVKVEYNGDFYILAEKRVEDIFKDKQYKLVGDVSTEEIVGKDYEQPYNYYESKRDEGCFKVVYADHATDEDGTGVVHLAPYGEEDFDVFMKMGIRIFDYLDDTAHFLDVIPEYKGLFYKAANKVILVDLEKNGVLFDTGTIVHRMPMCYRTKTPLIYRPIKSWYLAVTKIRDQMVKENQTVNWVPEHLKDGMSRMWISNARDWAISRNRYWGTPLPVWINDKTNEMVVLGSFEEVEKLSGTKIDDPHRPFVDEVTWEDTKNGGTFKRVTDVLDVWYDSGSVPFAKVHYPFENKENFELVYPADYIAEGLDQVRLWFYTMHVLGVALFDKVPYRNAVTSGMMLDKEGKKLAKSKKNFPPMEEVLDSFGADVLRLFVLTSPIVQGESARFHTDVLKDVKQEFFMPLWNSLRYFLTYANLANVKFDLEKPESNNELDKWILALLQKAINNATENLDKYWIMQASRELPQFVQDLSTWYIRRSRDRIKDDDVEALKTLYYVLVQFSRLVAPMTPMLAEQMYQILNVKDLTGLDSVHHDFYPEVVTLTKDQEKLIESMSFTRSIVSAALSIRVSKGLKVRQPLANLYVMPKDGVTIEFQEDLIKDEVNIKNVAVVSAPVENTESFEDKKFFIHLDIAMTEELETEGIARELIRKIQDLRKAQQLDVSAPITVTYEATEENKKAVAKFETEIKKKVLASELIAGEEYLVVLL